MPPSIKNTFMVKFLAGFLAKRFGGVWGWMLATVAPYVIDWMSREGFKMAFKFENQIMSTFDEKDWKETATQAWEQVEKGNLTSEQGKALDEKVKRAFDKFVVFTKVR